jgi:hypothetical protein
VFLELDVTFQGAETKSAHINGTDGDICVYTFLKRSEDSGIADGVAGMKPAFFLRCFVLPPVGIAFGLVWRYG